MGHCGMCGKSMKNCKENIFCPRTIISRHPHIIIENEFGEKTPYYSFASSTLAMEEYAEQVLLKENIGTREILTEKTEQ
jgi:hypothetical protein